MFIDRMRAQDYIDSSRAYLDYVEAHIEFVRKAFDELSRACEGMWWVGDDFNWHSLRSEVIDHDLSKLSKEEFCQYRDHFYPVCEEDKANSGFHDAWENHKANNHHHWETAETYNDMIHMLIDWLAMSYKFGDHPRDYYNKNADKIKVKVVWVEDIEEIFNRLDKYREQKG